MDLVIRIKEIKGQCPVYRVGDRFRLKSGYQLVSNKPICMHSLTSLLPYYNALQVSGPARWGLACRHDDSKAYIQCLDPHTYTGGGTVIFEVSREGGSGALEGESDKAESGGQVYPEPTVGALILDPEGKMFLMKSHKWKDRYCLPGGHIELGETIEEAVIREVKEETGLDVYGLEFICFQEFIYDEDFWEKRHFIFFDYSCKTDSKKVTLNEEAEEYIWVRPEDATSLPVEPYTMRTIETYLERSKGKHPR